jgi:hypothetical protein
MDAVVRIMQIDDIAGIGDDVGIEKGVSLFKKGIQNGRDEIRFGVNRYDNAKPVISGWGQRWCPARAEPFSFADPMEDQQERRHRFGVISYNSRVPHVI